MSPRYAPGGGGGGLEHRAEDDRPPATQVVFSFAAFGNNDLIDLPASIISAMRVAMLWCVATAMPLVSASPGYVLRFGFDF